MAAIDPQTASRLIGERLTCLPIESLPLDAMRRRGAARERLRRARSAAVRSRRDGWHRAGISRGGSGQRRLRMQATQPAGDPPLTLARPDQLHRGHDRRDAARRLRRVVPVEQIEVATASPSSGAPSPRPRTTTCTGAARDCRQGALLLSAGASLRSPEIAVAAGAGMARVRVSSQPRSWWSRPATN